MKHPSQPRPTAHRETDDPQASRYWEDLESAIMAQTIYTSSDLPPSRRKALLRVYTSGSFNAAAFGLEPDFSGSGTIAWAEDGSGGYALTYHTPYGVGCPLATIYRQPNNSWAALVVAGVKDDLHEAMAQAEWAISRLSAPQPICSGLQSKPLEPAISAFVDRNCLQLAGAQTGISCN